MGDGLECARYLKSGGSMMLTPYFSNQPYVAEILRTSVTNAGRARHALRKHVDKDWQEYRLEQIDGRDIHIYHSFVGSTIPFHRAMRRIIDENGKTIEIPVIKSIRRRDHFLYDFLMLRREEHLVLAVPFHGLANRLFLEIDTTLAGTRTEYERIDITKLVLQLGSRGRISLGKDKEMSSEMVITRCHLAYNDPGSRKRDIEQLRLTGANVGASEVYPHLINPVLKPDSSNLTVTPVLLGFALVTDGVRKSSATTDRHGNFKVTVGPGLRQLSRLFSLLDQVERLRNVVSTTSNVPILQSGALETE
jgi:hypothetical protein